MRISHQHEQHENCYFYMKGSRAVDNRFGNTENTTFKIPLHCINVISPTDAYVSILIHIDITLIDAHQSYSVSIDRLAFQINRDFIYLVYGNNEISVLTSW